jgi:hypothetical protein
LLPGQVNKFGIGAYCNYLGADLFESVVLLCQSSKFGGSDKSKVCGVEEENCPFLIRFCIVENEIPEIAFARVINLDFKRWNLLPDSQRHVFNHLVLLCMCWTISGGK